MATGDIHVEWPDMPNISDEENKAARELRDKVATRQVKFFEYLKQLILSKNEPHMSFIKTLGFENVVCKEMERAISDINKLHKEFFKNFPD